MQVAARSEEARSLEEARLELPPCSAAFGTPDIPSSCVIAEGSMLRSAEMTGQDAAVVVAANAVVAAGAVMVPDTSCLGNLSAAAPLLDVM